MEMRLHGGEAFQLKISLQDSGLQSKWTILYTHFDWPLQYHVFWSAFLIVWKVKNQLLSVLYEIYRYVDRVVDYIDDISENACNIQLVSSI